MNSKIALGLTAAACIVAAGAGAYFATRQNAADAVAVRADAPVAPESPAATASKPAASAETEALIQEEPVAPPAAERTPLSAERAPVVDAAPAERPAPRARARDRAAAPAPRAGRTARGEERPAPSEAPWPRTATADSRPAPEPAPPALAPVTGDSAASSASTWPSPAPAEAAPTTAPAPIEPSPAELPRRTFEEYIVSADSVIGLQLDTAVSSERARVEDRIEARVTRDVKVGDRVAIPAGTRVLGSIALVERGGKFKERARLGLRFHTLVLADGTRMDVNTETIYRDGAAPSKESAAKIGGAAVGGAILGAILGGGKGAILGGATGAAGGAGAVAAGDRNPVALPAGTTLTVRLTSPVTVTVERDEQ